MLKRRKEPVSIGRAPDRTVVVVRGRRQYRVREVIEQWDVRGRWWAGERHRRYVTLSTDRGTIEVVRDMKTGRWSLVGVHD